MAVAFRPYSHALGVLVLLVTVVVVAPLVLRTNGMLHQWTELNFSYLVIPLVLFGILLLFGRLLALLAHRTPLTERLTWYILIAGRRQPVPMLPIAQMVFSGYAWVALFSGALVAVARLPRTISAYAGVPDFIAAEAHLALFDSLAFWVVPALTPFVIARAASQVWSRIEDVIGFPVRRLIAFGGAYVLLAEGGVLFTAFELPGSRILLALGFALGLSYVASMLEALQEDQLPQRVVRIRRWFLLLSETGWILAALLAIVALSSAVETALTHHYKDDATQLDAYVNLIDSLVIWSVALVILFALVRASRFLWPGAAQVFGFPVIHMTVLAVVYVFLSRDGILTTEFQFPVRQLMFVLTLAVTLSYLSTVLRNVSRMALPGRLGVVIPIGSQLVRAVIMSAVAAMVTWVCINHFPVANARLLDYESTREFGQTYLPYFANLFDSRFAFAGLVFTMGLTLTLSQVLRTSQIRYRPLVYATGYSAAACLSWVAGSSLSDLGHGYSLIGGIVAAGLFSLSAFQLAGFATSASSPLVAGVGRWLCESKLRGFVLGASIAFYGLLLRPVVYEVLWFAALYEYLAVLALMMAALVWISNSVRRDADAPHSPQSQWPGWYHHEQLLETKIDPRSELVARFQHRYIEYGDWKPIWTYLVGLLYRNQAPLEAVQAVARPLRISSSLSGHLLLPSEHRRVRSRRMNALAVSLRSAEQALAAPLAPMSPVDVEVLKNASARYVESGEEPEALAAAIMAAQYHAGENAEAVAERWFPLVSEPVPAGRWFHPPWVRSRIRDEGKKRRLEVVGEALNSMFNDPRQRITTPVEAMS